ncbi:MAG: ribose-5-phosphate isomerase RpiA [Sphingomonas sp.]
MTRDEDKRAAAEAAVAEIRSGMIVGLGTGSTAAFAIAALGAKARAGLDVRAVATSLASERLARDAGIAVFDFADIAVLDLAIDGADEIDDQCRAIKGAGGAMLREKIVASAARRMIVVADGSKRVAALGAAPVPVEVLPFARTFAEMRLGALGATPILRGGGAYRTDQGNLVFDCRFAALADPAAAAARLAAIPGAVGHGLFLDEVDAAYIASDGIVTRLERDQRSG